MNVKRMQAALGLVFVLAGVGLFAPASWDGALWGACIVAALFGLLPDDEPGPHKPDRAREWKPPTVPRPTDRRDREAED